MGEGKKIENRWNDGWEAGRLREQFLVCNSCCGKRQKSESWRWWFRIGSDTSDELTTLALTEKMQAWQCKIEGWESSQGSQPSGFRFQKSDWTQQEDDNSAQNEVALEGWLLYIFYTTLHTPTVLYRSYNSTAFSFRNVHSQYLILPLSLTVLLCP